VVISIMSSQGECNFLNKYATSIHAHAQIAHLILGLDAYICYMCFKILGHGSQIYCVWSKLIIILYTLYGNNIIRRKPLRNRHYQTDADACSYAIKRTRVWERPHPDAGASLRWEGGERGDSPHHHNSCDILLAI